MKTFCQGVLILLVFTVITGVVYPVGIWAIGQLLWPQKANGDRMLIGQSFENDRYFFSRPSASNYTAVPAAASNLGPISASLMERISLRREELAKKHKVQPQDVPVDLITASASGLDPHISVAAAQFQVKRVARARRLSDAQEAELAQIVEKYSQAPQWGLFGESRVNVLALNLAIDQAFAK